MTFDEVLKLLKQGKTLARDAWKIGEDLYDKYIILVPGVESIWQNIITEDKPQTALWLIKMKDFAASDWKVVTHENLVPKSDVKVDEVKAA